MSVVPAQGPVRGLVEYVQYVCCFHVLGRRHYETSGGACGSLTDSTCVATVHRARTSFDQN
jgi:hypothetical protein